MESILVWIVKQWDPQAHLLLTSAQSTEKRSIVHKSEYFLHRDRSMQCRTHSREIDSNLNSSFYRFPSYLT